MNRMRTMTGGHRLVVPVTGTGTDRHGSARTAPLIRWPREIPERLAADLTLDVRAERGPGAGKD
jgi:hypothetical protein